MRFPGASAQHVQAALYCQGLIYHDSQSRRGGLARFANHCCDPNCYTRIIRAGGKDRIVLYTKRAIEPGEEITYDYKFDRDEDESKRIPCRCGAVPVLAVIGPSGAMLIRKTASCASICSPRGFSCVRPSVLLAKIAPWADAVLQEELTLAT